MSGVKKKLLWILAGGTGFVLVTALAGMLLFSSDWFRRQVRERIVTEVERATGGRAEISSFTFDWRSLRAEVRGFVLHGSEPAGHPPLFRADSIIVGLKIVSAFRRDVDIALLEVNRPELSIEVQDDGRTNLPRPGPSWNSGGNVIAPLVRLAIRRFRLTNGVCRFASRTTPLEVNAENVEVHARFDAARAAYLVRLEAKQVKLNAPLAVPVTFGTAMQLTVGTGQVTIREARLASANSTLQVSGTVKHLADPLAEVVLRADLAGRDLVPSLGLPMLPQGSIRIQGKASYASREQYSVEATAVAEGLGVANQRIRLAGIGASAVIRMDPKITLFNELTVSALSATFTGNAVVERGGGFRLEGDVNDIQLARLLPRLNVRNFAWNASVSGPVLLEGRFPAGASAGVRAQVRLTLTPAAEGIPLEGFLAAAVEQPGGVIRFGASYLASGSTRIDFSGGLDEGIRLSLFTQNLEELLPAAALAGRDSGATLPFRLEKGVAQFGGLLSGTLDNPRLAGHVSVGPLAYRGRRVDNVAADFDLSRDRFRLRSLSARQGASRLKGDGEIALTDWRVTGAGALSGELTLEGGSLQQLVADAGVDVPLEGAISGSATLSGTLDQPLLLVQLHATGLTAYGEPVDSVEATLRYSAGWLRIERGRLRAAAGELRFQGAYRHPAGEWENGTTEFELAAAGFRLAQWKTVQRFRAGLDAGIEGHLQGTVQVSQARPVLRSLTGDVSLSGVVLEDRRLGDARLTASTRGRLLTIVSKATLKKAEIRSRAEWSLTGAAPGLGQIEFTNLTLDALQDVGLFGGPETDLHLDGVMDGEIGFTGPVLEPARWRGMAKVNRFEITPRARRHNGSDRDLTLRNAGPLLFAIDPEKISVDSVRLVSPDTDLEVTGTLSYHKKNPWDLRLAGSADLAVLTAFRPDLQAEGKSTVDAAIRGSLLHPQINGHLEFDNGSFYLRDLPNGIEQVNGTILFDRTRATIEKFTSRTGGGTLRLAGFVGFGGEEWVYRLQATAERVRIRYPAGVSTQLDATLDLTGTATRSMLSGEVTVTRAAFQPSTDLGTILTQTMASRPLAEVSNPFLRGMQLDLHIGTAANAEFLTSLTRDIEMEADLRLRGSVSRPILLGRVAINRGEILFFGNKYTITQGEVTFFNPVKIEPVLAMDLETRIRGYTVMMNFSGPLDKLNFSYRSDPPLESREIIALLTVGRTPSYGNVPEQTTGAANQSFLQAGGNSFLGQALAAPVSSRLQRFFGVSRIKIDPQLTGVDNTPETHVTIEQQISREITLTYVTNLARTQQQIVRLEWNFQEGWSVYAVRDSNGVFGVDFVYRRRFK